LPLVAVKRPALKDGLIGVWSPWAVTFEHASHPRGAIVFGGDLIVPGLGARGEVGAGIGFDGDIDKPRLAIDAGLVGTLGLSWSGLVSHEVDLGALFLISGDLDVTLRLEYRPTIEAGYWLLRLDLGPAFDVETTDFGLYVGIGLARL